MLPVVALATDLQATRFHLPRPPQCDGVMGVMGVKLGSVPSLRIGRKLHPPRFRRLVLLTLIGIWLGDTSLSSRPESQYLGLPAEGLKLGFQ